MEFRNARHSDLVYVDTLAGDIFLEVGEDIRRYQAMFDHLRATAISPVRGAAFITSAQEGLK